MWMGGFVPRGYDIVDRKLVINEAEAATVRHIFQRFVELGSATLLTRELVAGGTLNKRGKPTDRSEESRVGRACVRQCRCRWSTDHLRKKPVSRATLTHQKHKNDTKQQN